MHRMMPTMRGLLLGSAAAANPPVLTSSRTTTVRSWDRGMGAILSAMSTLGVAAEYVTVVRDSWYVVRDFTSGRFVVAAEQSRSGAGCEYYSFSLCGPLECLDPCLGTWYHHPAIRPRCYTVAVATVVRRGNRGGL